MKKRNLLFLGVLALLVVIVGGIFLFSKQPQKDVPSKPEVKTDVVEAESPNPSDDEKNLPNFIDVKNTEELRALFKGVRFDRIPRIFVRRFPKDFAEKGDSALFATVLLPYILRENELLADERKVFLFLSPKVERGEELTDVENAMWDKLVYKYEVLDPDKTGQRETLFNRIDRISPALAVAQALEATNLGKEDLDAPFDVRRWNDKKEYVFVRYPNLAEAVTDYALEINRGYSYLKFHMLRTAQRASLYHPFLGRSFARRMVYYKLEDPDYVRKLDEIFKWYKIKKLDESKFE